MFPARCLDDVGPRLNGFQRIVTSQKVLDFAERPHLARKITHPALALRADTERIEDEGDSDVAGQCFTSRIRILSCSVGISVRSCGVGQRCPLWRARRWLLGSRYCRTGRWVIEEGA